jgi:hypothetical protein
MTSDDWRQGLMQRHASLFARGGALAVGSGWRELIEKAVERIAVVAAGAPGDEITITQIKEKFGGLRIYFNAKRLPDDTLARIREAIDLAEARADCTCETCGAQGRLYYDDGWYVTCCEVHAQGEPVRRRPNYSIWRPAAGGVGGMLGARRYDRERDAFVDVPAAEIQEDPE